MVVVAFDRGRGRRLATSVVLADLLSLLHAAAAPTRANRPKAAPKRRRRRVINRGEYMVITTSKELGERRWGERKAFGHRPFCPVGSTDFRHPRFMSAVGSGFGSDVFPRSRDMLVRCSVLVRQQLVLAMLLAAPNSVISTDVLVDRLWEDSPPSAALDRRRSS